MIQLSYYFHTKIQFTEHIYDHSFLLKCVPNIYDFQHTIETKCTVSPNAVISFGHDSFGNFTQNGFISPRHNSFEFISEGIVHLITYRMAETLNKIYLYPSALTKPDESIVKLKNDIVFEPGMDTIAKVSMLSNEIHKRMVYESGVTNVQTTGSQAMEMRKGVCQDFAHILISLCRLCNIPARYVAGFMYGEGFSHAWVEYYDNGSWYGFDPTHNRYIIDDPYIKLSHGRDYNDCVIDRGVFKGVTQQNLDVFLKVENIQQQ